MPHVVLQSVAPLVLYLGLHLGLDAIPDFGLEIWTFINVT